MKTIFEVLLPDSSDTFKWTKVSRKKIQQAQDRGVADARKACDGKYYVCQLGPESHPPAFKTENWETKRTCGLCGEDYWLTSEVSHFVRVPHGELYVTGYESEKSTDGS